MSKVIGTASEILVAVRDWAKGKFVAKEAGKGLSTNDLTATLKSNYDTAYTNSHTHSNKSVLDGITSAKVTAWDGAIPSSQKGVANGVATLGSDGKVPSSQLPSYVDDVLEYADKASFPSAGETGKIYVAKDTNIVYRWSGSAYVEISSSLALGETSSTAYRGDRGKIAYDHSQSAHAPSNAQANVIETVKVNGTALTPSNKAVDISVPTNTNQLTNGAGFITASSSAVTNKVVANTAITGATKCKITYDNKGLVTGGADLAESDIPSIHKSKISDFAHTHAISDVTSLQTTLNTKANANIALLRDADNYYVVGNTHAISFGDPTEQNHIIVRGNGSIELNAENSVVDIALQNDADDVVGFEFTTGGVFYLSADEFRGKATNAGRADSLLIDGSTQTLSFMTATEMTNILNS